MQRANRMQHSVSFHSEKIGLSQKTLCAMPCALYYPEPCMSLLIPSRENSFNRVVLHQIPDAARAGARAKATTDAKILINRILVATIVEFFSADCKLRANGYANSAVATRATGRAL